MAAGSFGSGKGGAPTLPPSVRMVGRQRPMVAANAERHASARADFASERPVAANRRQRGRHSARNGSTPSLSRLKGEGLDPDRRHRPAACQEARRRAGRAAKRARAAAPGVAGAGPVAGRAQRADRSARQADRRLASAQPVQPPAGGDRWLRADPVERDGGAGPATGAVPAPPLHHSWGTIELQRVRPERRGGVPLAALAAHAPTKVLSWPYEGRDGSGNPEGRNAG